MEEEVPAHDHTLRIPDNLYLEASALLDWMGNPDLVLLDARSEEEYVTEHVEGAISFPFGWTLDPDNDQKLPPVPRMEELFGGVGIDETKTVVVYDDGEMRSAARVLWALQVHGHAQTAVLAGGLGAWRGFGGRLGDVPGQPKPTTFIARVSAEHLASLLETRQAIEDSETVIIDVRSAEEFAGGEDRWPRGGHVPGALNIDWRENFVSQSGHEDLRSPEALRHLYGLEPGTRVIAYCTRGRRAAVTYLALRAAGFEAAVYDGSWTEWSSHPEVPIETSLPATTGDTTGH